MKKILVICGGAWQVPLIKKAKELGYIVVNSNLYEDSIGFEYSDYGEVADVRDKEKNLQFAIKHSVDAVVTDQSDIAVPTVAYVASKMGLPTIGEEMAHLFTDKHNMREFCRKTNFPYPEFALCKSVEDVRQFYKSVSKKIIIKPIDSQSSRGVYEIDDEDEIDALFMDAIQYSSDKQSVIAERYIQGTEFTVDGIVTPSGHVSLCISQKNHFSYNENVASELFFSHTNRTFDYELLKQTNDSLINATGLPFGLTHAEYKFEDGKYYLIEFAARGGGTKIASDIVPIMSGVDNYAYLLASVMGEEFSGNLIPDPTLSQRCAVLKFLDINSNGKKVKAIHGVDKVLANKNVVDFGLSFDIGDIVGEAADDSTRAGRYIAYEESEEKLRDLMEWIERTIEIET